jgi:hypothetical protein
MDKQEPGVPGSGSASPRKFCAHRRYMRRMARIRKAQVFAYWDAAWQRGDVNRRGWAQYSEAANERFLKHWRNKIGALPE